MIDLSDENMPSRTGPDRMLITRLFLCGASVATIAARAEIESAEVEGILRLALVFAKFEQAMSLPQAEGAPGIAESLTAIP